MAEQIRFVGMSGSLRKDSLNTRLLNALDELMPEDIAFETVSIADLPLYNADLDLPAVSQRPARVDKFRNSLAKAQAIIFVSPEYNYSIPGGLKNAIDWASRGEDSPLKKKAVAVMGATTGLWGTVRMQMAFLSVFVFLDMKPVLQPEVLLAKAESKFGADGKLNDDLTKNIIRKKLEALKKLAS
jgi:chromate reductase, NAD(P)H dehydrogenase (quinone)